MQQLGRHRKRRKLKAEINVVPYIDVMLVLLIIFMVTAPLLNLGVDIQLPQSKARSIQNDKEPAVVSVDKDGHLFLTLGPAKREPIDSPSCLRSSAESHTVRHSCEGARYGISAGSLSGTMST